MADSRATSDATYMKKALALARKGLGRTAPNPPVGAVIVKQGRIIGKGFHRKAGEPHAEAMAISSAEEPVRGADMFVTLEPCDHHGRTPPCSLAIIGAGIRRVVVGTLDPNPLVRGKGVARLKAAGVKVDVGVLSHGCRDLISGYTHWLETKRPLVTLKAAVTIDGYIATGKGHSQWVSGEKARAMVMKLRDACDAVLVGAGTVKADDPLLTARVKGGRDPVRVVLDGNLSSPVGARIFDTGTGGDTIVYTTKAGGSRRKAGVLSGKGVEVVSLPGTEGCVSWSDVLDDLGGRGFHNLLVEGGGSVFSGLLRAKYADKACIFVAPKILTGGDGIRLAGIGPGPEEMTSAIRLSGARIRKVEPDVLFEGWLDYSAWEDA